jgi:hypothetical protein
MATYEIDITRKQMKTVRLSVRDDIPGEDVREWAEDYANLSDLFDTDPGQNVAGISVNE